MYAAGHYGMALLVYAPVGTVGFATGHDALALVGAAGVLALAKLPDIDRDLILVSHRGVTHTFAFMLAVAGVLGGAAALVGGDSLGRPLAAAVGFGIGFLGIGSHLLADLLTPSGVALFWPLSSKRYSLSLARSDNLVANYLLLALGVGVSVAVVFGTAALR